MSIKFKVIIHEAEEGGYWAEVPVLPGCSSQGETLEETKENVQEAITVCLDSLQSDFEDLKDTNRIFTLEV